MTTKKRVAMRRANFVEILREMFVYGNVRLLVETIHKEENTHAPEKRPWRRSKGRFGIQLMMFAHSLGSSNHRKKLVFHAAARTTGQRTLH
mmetsp:Transcript_31777/g.66328  ORF Transcript_31777/g.66328 Transcript_31777/m.66328 type:complete len:91 (-) Transcript_31777:2696-2968(-)